MIKIDPPHVTGASDHEKLQQLINYVRRLVEQLNIELNMPQEKEE
jgi:hypothetical protein